MWNYVKEVDQSAQDLLRGIGTGMYKGGLNIVDLLVPEIPKMVDGEMQRVRPEFWQNVLDHADEMNSNSRNHSTPAAVGSFIGGAAPEVAAMLRGNPAILPTIIREMAATYGSGGNETGDRIENAALTGAFGGVGLGAGKLIDYGVDTLRYLFSKDTPEIMAAEILKNKASDPQNLKGNLNSGIERSEKLYPGVSFNSADLMGNADDNISALTREVGNRSQDYGVIRDNQYRDQNQFILNQLDDLAGVNAPGKSILQDGFEPKPGESARQYLERIRREKSSPYWNEFDSGDWVSNDIKDIRNEFRISPTFQQAEEQAVNTYKDLMRKSPDPEWNEITSQMIDTELRTLRDEALREARSFNDPKFKAIDQVFNDFRQNLYEASPAYKNAITTYAENSPHINSMQVFNKLREKSLNPYGRNSLDIETNRPDDVGGFSANRLWSAMDNLDQYASQAKGTNATFKESVRPEDKKRFDAINNLLTTRHQSSVIGKARGSDTARLLNYSQDLKDRVTNTMFPQLSPSRPVRLANYGLRRAFDLRQEAITNALNRALYDPEYMSSILRRTNPQDTYVRGTWGDGLNLYGLTMSEGYQD